jgi:hypothetical protein
MDVDQLNSAGLSHIGGTKFSVFTPSPGASVVATPNRCSPSAQISLNLAAVSASLLKSTTTPDDLYERSTLPESYFTFSILNHPERLVVHWPAHYDPNFLKAASQVAKTFRDEERDPSFVDFVVCL